MYIFVCNRYDEWIKSDRIVHVVYRPDRPESTKKVSTHNRQGLIFSYHFKQVVFNLLKVLLSFILGTVHKNIYYLSGVK